MEGLALLTILISIVFVVTTSRSGRPAPATVWFVVLGIVFNFYAYFLFYGQSDALGKSRILFGFTIFCTGMIAFICVATLGRAMRVKRPFDSAESLGEGIREAEATTENRRKALVLMVSAAVVILIPSWIYFVLLGYVPLFEGLNSVSTSGLGGLGELQISRLSRDATLSNSGARIPLQGLWELFRNVGTPFLVALAIAQIQAGHRKTFRVIILILAVTTSLLAGQRWPLIYTIVAVLATFTFLRPLKLSVRRVRIFLLGAVLFGVGVGISTLQKRTLETFQSTQDAVAFGFNNLIGRILVEQSQTSVLSYLNESFKGGELGGRSYWLAIQAYLPGQKQATFPVEFYQTVYQTSAAYTAPPDFFTEAYLNFDVVGVVLAAILWGLVATKIDLGTFHPDRITDTAIKGGVAALFASTVFTGPSYLLGGSIVLVILLAVLRMVDKADRARRIRRKPVAKRMSLPSTRR